MSKSILVIDTPKSCDMCSFYDEDYCGVLGCGEEVGDYIKCRPDWCPLKELPRKKMLIGIDGVSSATEIRERSRQEGYNACIDEILKECD